MKVSKCISEIVYVVTSGVRRHLFMRHRCDVNGCEAQRPFDVAPLLAEWDMVRLDVKLT